MNGERSAAHPIVRGVPCRAPRGWPCRSPSASASTSSAFVIRLRPLTPSLRAWSIRCCLLALASTPPAVFRVRVAPAGGLGVARTLLLLGLPVVAGLLERVLQRGERGAVCPFTLAVLSTALSWALSRSPAPSSTTAGSCWAFLGGGHRDLLQRLYDPRVPAARPPKPCAHAPTGARPGQAATTSARGGRRQSPDVSPRVGWVPHPGVHPSEPDGAQVSAAGWPWRAAITDLLQRTRLAQPDEIAAAVVAAAAPLQVDARMYLVDQERICARCRTRPLTRRSPSPSTRRTRDGCSRRCSRCRLRPTGSRGCGCRCSTAPNGWGCSSSSSRTPRRSTTRSSGRAATCSPTWSATWSRPSSRTATRC